MAFPVGINKAAQFKPGQSGNPAGKPKGTIHISAHIQKMLEDPNFETDILDSKDGLKHYKGAPVKAIIAVAIHKALHDPKSAAVFTDILFKYGYKQKVDITTNDESLNTATMSDDELEQRLAYLISKRREGATGDSPGSGQTPGTD
jgi:hypothetical protein